MLAEVERRFLNLWPSAFPAALFNKRKSMGEVVQTNLEFILQKNMEMIFSEPGLNGLKDYRDYFL